MVATRRLAKLTAALGAAAQFPQGPLVVALSGGSDSSALALLSSESGQPVRAVHVDHGTPQAPEMSDAAIAVADRLSMPLIVVSVDLGGEPFSEGRGRDARYAALADQRQDGEWILTGHTIEDQAETVIMNLLRGTGSAGLAGIPPVAGQGVARPLLDLARGELRELATLAQLPFADDPSNSDLRFTRNRIRLEVMPLLHSAFNPQLTRSLARTAKSVRRDLDLMDDMASRIPVSATQDEAKIAVSVALTIPRQLVDRALRAMMSRIRPPHPPTSEELEIVWQVIRGETPTAQLAGGIAIDSTRGMLRLSRGPDHGEAPPVQSDQ